MMSKHKAKRQRAANKPPEIYLEAADSLDQLLLGKPTNEVMRKVGAERRREERDRVVRITPSTAPVIAIIDRQICLKCGEAQSFLRCIGRWVTTQDDSFAFQMTIGIEPTTREVVVSRVTKCPSCLSGLPAVYKDIH